jgi:hypothetical protein
MVIAGKFTGKTEGIAEGRKEIDESKITSQSIQCIFDRQARTSYKGHDIPLEKSQE